MTYDKEVRRIAGWFGLAGAALGLAILCGWLAGVDALAMARTATQPIPANTAVALMFSGLALWLSSRRARRIPVFLCAAVPLLLGTLTLAEYAFDIRIGIDDLLVREHAAQLPGPHPGRIGKPGAVVLLILAVGLLCTAGRPGRGLRIAATWMATFVVAAGLSALLPLFVAPAAKNPDGGPIWVGSDLAPGLLLLGLGLLTLQTGGRFIGTLVARTPTGSLARRLIFGLAVVPCVFYVALAIALQRGLIGIVDGAAIFILALVLSGIGIAVVSLNATAELDNSREQAEGARLHLTARLQEQAAQLQETVATRTRELREVNASLRAAAEANARLALVANHATNGVVISDAQGRIEWVNASFERMTGYNIAELRGQKPGHLLQGSATDPAAAAKLRTASRRGEASSVEILNYTKLGTPYWVIIDIQPVRDAGGQLINFISVQTDITAQRRAQGLLEAANRRILLAAQAAGLGVWEGDFDTDRCEWDDRMLALYGLTRETFHGTYGEWVARLHPEDAEEAQRTLRQIQEGAESFDRTFRIIRADDGAVRTIQSRAIARRAAAGRLLGCTGAERDVTKEREANQRLIELNERFQLALRSSQFGVWETDLATGRMHWDDRMLEIYGLPRAEFDGQRATWKNTIHPDDRAAALARTARAFTGEDTFYANEFRIVRPDGTVRHIEAHGQLLRDAAGKPLRLVGLNRDISLERKTEAALQLVEERWQLALQGNNDGVWDWDIASDHFFYDTRYCVMLGFALGELPNHSAGHFKLLHPDDRAEFEKENQDHLDGLIAHFQHEHRMQSKSGEWVWILDRAKVVSRAPDGRPLRMVGTHTDITARKHLEQRLRQAEQLSQQVGQLAQIGGWELQLASGRLSFTEGARRIHEFVGDQPPTLEEVLAFFPLEARETLKAALYSRTVEEPSFDYELPFVSSKGRSLWVRVIGHAEFREGRAVSLRGALQDITSRHESEGARRELEGQLFQAQKMETLGTLAGGIAHDFNNLLTGIIGYHELAADTIPEDHPARACLNEARGASMRARDLVEQILTFSRQSAGEEHEAVDLTLVLKEAGRFLRATLAANVIIETDIPEDAGRVLANTTQIYQVVLNLGSNAAHAMRPNGGTLRISLQPTDVGAERPGALSSVSPGRYLRLDVSDTGHGMNEATLRRIFDPFFTTKNTREGTGLGLAVVHGIIRAHRSVIDVESTPGVGTVFHIYLPVAEQTVPPDPGDHVNAPAGQGQLVYVVDDEELVGRFIKLALVGIGYEVQAFTSAESCLAAFNLPGAKCDLLLTDQTMPGQQGTELAAVMQARLPEMPVIIMSGYFSKVPTQSLGELRNAHLLAKPFTTDELAHALNRAWQLATIRPA